MLGYVMFLNVFLNFNIEGEKLIKLVSLIESKTKIGLMYLKELHI